MSTLALHALAPRSRANGPGTRFVLWLQGCTLACPGCFNPDTHAGEPAQVLSVDEVLHRLDSAGDLEGITLSGGEPLQQPEPVLALLRRVRAETALSTLIFSGYAIEEIRTQPLGPAILAHLDVLIDGRYQAPSRLGRGLRGSANQRIHLLTDRYSLEQVEDTPEAEARIEADGTVTLTGIAPLRLR